MLCKKQHILSVLKQLSNINLTRFQHNPSKLSAGFILFERFAILPGNGMLPVEAIFQKVKTPTGH